MFNCSSSAPVEASFVTSAITKNTITTPPSPAPSLSGNPLWWFDPGVIWTMSLRGFYFIAPSTSSWYQQISKRSKRKNFPFCRATAITDKPNYWNDMILLNRVWVSKFLKQNTNKKGNWHQKKARVYLPVCIYLCIYSFICICIYICICDKKWSWKCWCQ